MKVLVVDDSEDALAVARARLAKERVEVLCASSGRAGLDLARAHQPDLILLDLDMPDMSGFDVCRALKADAALCMVPVIFLSGSAHADDRIRGLDLGAVDYITKPFDAFELRARVRAALRTKHLQDMLIEHAHVDPLTGLANRRALDERLCQEWARIGRHGGSLSFIMADVDLFKRVNDAHGHHAGDRVLCEVAVTLAAQCRETDFPARYGGEEFAILVPGVRSSDAACLAERCRKSIEGLVVNVSAEEIRVTASFGVGDDRECRSPEDLAASADRKLYEAKVAGRNVVRSTDPPPVATPADAGSPGPADDRRPVGRGRG